MKKAVLVSCFDWYDERLKYIENYLNCKGYDIKILLSDFNHLKKEYKKQFVTNEHVEYIHALKYKKNISISRIISHILFSYEVKNRIINEKPNLVYCLVPPNTLVELLTHNKKKCGYKLVFDLIDMWPESFPKKKKNCLFSIWQSMRDRKIYDADRIVIECEYYKHFLNDSYSRISVLRLVKPPIDFLCEYDEYKEEVCLGYLGSINSLIDIDRICNMVKCIAKTRSVLVKVVGDGANKEFFRQRLEESGAKVKLYGTVYDEKKLKSILGNCDFGLNIYKENLNIGLTMKSVSYFQIGIPILNSISGDTYEIVKQYNAGININDYLDDDIPEMISNYSGDTNRVFDEMFNSKSINERLNFLDAFC